MRVKRFVSIAIALLVSQLLLLRAVAEERMPDVRLLIDVSGSMRQSDPDNLRAPALNLMLRLLPEGSRAGVWTFGKRVNMLVQHRLVDMQWREDAAVAVGSIGNHGLLTNIPDALELATFDAERLRYDYKTSVILLTDGKVEVSEDPIDNARAARDLLQKRAIELRDLGIEVHTIALSDNADWPFLRELAQATGGLAEKAESAQALSATFLQALDIAAPTEQVPLLSGEFLIDSRVTEFTLLVFPETPADPVSLANPAGERFTELSHGDSMQWFHGDSFSLLTVSMPAAGTWRVEAPGAIARVNVLSDLSLRVDGLETSIPAGHEPELGLRLVERGSVVTDPELLAVLAITVVVRRGSGESWEVSPPADDIPGSGEFRVRLPMLSEPGRYTISVSLDGGSFQRELTMVSDVLAHEPMLEPGDIPEPASVGNSGWILPVAATLALLLGLLWWRRRKPVIGEQSASAAPADAVVNPDEGGLISGMSATEDRSRET